MHKVTVTVNNYHDVYDVESPCIPGSVQVGLRWHSLGGRLCLPLWAGLGDSPNLHLYHLVISGGGGGFRSSTLAKTNTILLISVTTS